MKIFTVIGTRPNIIKVDPGLEQTIIHTGQHYDENMSGRFLNDLELPKPQYNLGFKSEETGAMMDSLREIFKKEKPDIVIVFGDTNSSLAGALAAAYQNVKVAHVEAGLRSHNRRMPEELNRIVIDHVSDLLFCPNNIAAVNLAREGITQNVHVVGDPSFDAMGRFLPIEDTKDRGRYIIMTLHRNINVDDPERLKRILEGVLGQETVIFPAHPRTKRNLRRFKLKLPKNVKLIPPQRYEKSLILISNARKVITDSGGVQREAFWFNVPVIIVREETEWEDIVAKGASILVGDDPQKIRDAIENFKGTINPPPLFNANKRIRDIIYRHI